MTYARARLWLGICGVGFWVTLSAAMLFFAIPARLFSPQSDSFLSDLRSLSIFLTAYIVLSLPFDFLGGYGLPHRFHRLAPTWSRFLFTLARGVFGQALIMLIVGCVLLTAGRTGGRFGATIAVIFLMIGLLVSQGLLARWIGGLRLVSVDLHLYRAIVDSWNISLPAKTNIFEVTDPAFVGGWVGLPGRECLVLPSKWLPSQSGVLQLNTLSVEAVALQISRRVGVLQSGSRSRGILLALVWNVSGFYLATFLPGAGVNSVAAIISTACGFTLWSFAGLLLLPSLSRPGVLAGDYFALQRRVSQQLFEKTITTLDKLQDDEPTRSAGIETIFHPIPSVESRLAWLEKTPPEPIGAWQSARVALFLSWGCLGLLSRAVHCNSGRPELWVLFPGD
jgi:hypothetical protein